MLILLPDNKYLALGIFFKMSLKKNLPQIIQKPEIKMRKNYGSANKEQRTKIWDMMIPRFGVNFVKLLKTHLMIVVTA